MANKKKYTKFQTPIGVAKYPSLSQPDTRWDDDGVYKVDLILSAEDATPLLELCASHLERALREGQAEAKDPSSVKVADSPLQPEEDEEGNPTGNYVLKIKAKAKYKDKATDAMKNVIIPFWDTKAQRIADPEGLKIGGGSRLRVKGLISTYYIPGTKTAGITCRLAEVQVVSLRQYGAEGFDRVEDGDYVNPTEVVVVDNAAASFEDDGSADF